ncbi:hypothetical protein VTN00DRAFT_5449 [Thermoascus crustaceus]|uniref:uncharacterized protein n=1 Tax=Thermoascus crustaceus TaxID=5088 RepID=UPI003742165F
MQERHCLSSRALRGLSAGGPSGHAFPAQAWPVVHAVTPPVEHLPSRPGLLIHRAERRAVVVVHVLLGWRWTTQPLVPVVIPLSSPLRLTLPLVSPRVYPITCPGAPHQALAKPRLTQSSVHQCFDPTPRRAHEKSPCLLYPFSLTYRASRGSRPAGAGTFVLLLAFLSQTCVLQVFH